MRSLKNLSLLSLVALTGATFSVGSTFGWWQDDKPATDPQLKSDGKSDSGPVVKPVVAPISSHAAIENLIKQFEAEARENAERGRKDIAEHQLRVVKLLRDTLMSTSRLEVAPFQPRVPFTGAPAPSPRVIIKRHLEPVNSELPRRIEELKRQLEQSNPDERPKLEAQLDEVVRIHKRAEELAKAQQQRLEAVFLNDIRSGDGKRAETNAQGVGPHIEGHLRQVADQLEKGGHIDAARNIREGAERIQKDLRSHQIHDHLNRVKILKSQGGKPEVVYVETPDGVRKTVTDGEQTTVIINLESKGGPHRLEVRRDPKPELKQDPKPKLDPKVDDSKTPDKKHPKTGEASPDLGKLLVDLRQEISQLRKEVRELRSDLKKDNDEQQEDGPGDAKDGDNDDRVRDERREDESHRIKREGQPPQLPGKEQDKQDD